MYRNLTILLVFVVLPGIAFSHKCPCQISKNNSFFSFDELLRNTIARVSIPEQQTENYLQRPVNMHYSLIRNFPGTGLPAVNTMLKDFKQLYTKPKIRMSPGPFCTHEGLMRSIRQNRVVKVPVLPGLSPGQG